MNFEIDVGDFLSLSDDEISGLLWNVYVNEGFTNAEKAKVIFEPSAVRKRGLILCARSKSDDSIAGMIILVPPSSQSKMYAKENEAEIHLLAVKTQFRNFGLGKALVNEVMRHAINFGFKKILLWTQPTMISAQKLYESIGFDHILERDFEKDGRKFLFYEKLLPGL